MLTLIEKIGIDGRYKCHCGGERVIRISQVNSGRYKSCGCSRYANRVSVSKLSKGEASLNQFYRVYQANAATRKLNFDLTKEQFTTLVKRDCVYCGVKPSKSFQGGKKYNGAFLANGVDRIDNSKGYTLDNAAPCCETCNRAKLTMTADAYKAHCRKVASRRETFLEMFRRLKPSVSLPTDALSRIDAC